MSWELADNIRGPKGDKGDTGTVSSVSVATLPPDQAARVRMSGETDVHVHFEIPRGEKGDQGLPGTLSSASAESVPAGQSAEVVMSGTTEVKHAHFKVPRGLPGVNAVENDEAVAAYADAEDSELRAALERHLARRPENGAPAVGQGELVLNVKDFGAKGDGVADDTAAFQAAIDYANGLGGGLINIPHGNYRFTRFLMRKGVYLRGAGIGAFGTGGTPFATRLWQFPDVNRSGIGYTEPVSGNGRYYAGPFGISHLELTAHGTTSSTGYGIDLTDDAGNAHCVQDTVAIHDILVSRFPSGGIMFPQGAFPLHVRDVNLLWNGGPGISYVRGAAGATQAVHFDNISGDGNVGCLIYVDDNNSSGSGNFLFTNLKSEKRVNPHFGGGGAQQDVVVQLHNTRVPVTVINVNHYSSAPDGETPGPVIRATSTSTVPPRIKWMGVQHVTAAGQSGPELILRDEIAGHTIPKSVVSGEYSPTREGYRASTGNSRDVFGRPGAPAPATGTNVAEVAGDTPAYLLYENDAPVDGKLWGVYLSSGNFSIRRLKDNGADGDLVLEMVGRTSAKFVGAVQAPTLEATTISGGIRLASPNGTKYRIAVSDTGVLSAVAV